MYDEDTVAQPGVAIVAGTASGVLPVTGSSTMLLVLVAFFAIGAGLLLTRVARRASSRA